MRTALATRTGQLLLTAAVLVAVSTGRFSLVAAEDRLEMPPLKARWQTMPKQVHGVVIGPDGRRWLQFSQHTAQPIDVIKAAISAEFAQAEPQIRHAELTLIEPGGRAWFYVQGREKLLGYDGKSWIERSAKSGSRFASLSPSLGRLKHGGLESTFAGGRAFFMDSAGVHSFDGSDWNYLELPQPKPGRSRAMLFASSPSGRWVVVCAGSPRATLWSLEDGAWKERSDWSIDGADSGAHIVVTDDGRIGYLNRSKRALSWYRLAPEATEPSAPKPSQPSVPAEDLRKAKVAELIRQLDDDSYQVRSSAQDELLRFNLEILSQLTQAKEVATSEEVRQRLAIVIAELRTRPQPGAVAAAAPPRPKGPQTALGDLMVSGVGSLYQDDAGRLIAAADQVEQQGHPLRAATVIVSPEGRAQVIVDEVATSAMLRFQHGHSAPIFNAERDKLWIQRPPSAAGPLCLDLKSGETVHEIPDGQYQYMTAVDSQGRVYLSHFLAASSAGNLVMAYSPEAPEDRLPLKAQTHAIMADAALVASDGSVWASRPNEGIARFDGEGWTTIDSARGVPRLLAAGVNGEVLLQSTDYALWRGKERLASGGTNLKAFVEEHRSLITAAFDAKKLRPWAVRQHSSPIVDAAGNIWLIEVNQLHVLAGNKWIDTTDLPELRTPPGVRRLMTPVGIGEHIYLSDMRPESKDGRSYLARVEKGELVLTATTHCFPYHHTLAPLRTGSGDLWINGELRRDKIPTGHFIARLSATGEQERIENQGIPLLLDKSQNLWLAPTRTGPNDRLSLWRDGKLRQTLELPQVDRVSALISDRPGSVFALSSRGLEHLVAERPDYDRFEHRATYAVSGVAKQLQSCDYSSLGYLVAVNHDTAAPPGPRLHLIKLPEGPAE